jgi:hypothetical protein
MRRLFGASLGILLSVAASDAIARGIKGQHQYAAISREDVCKTLASSAHAHGLPLAFFGNLIYQESGYKPHIVSHVGARGIAQFMPSTARLVGLRNPFNPREALPASAKFLRSLLHQFGNNYGLAAAAYNAGPGRIQRWIKRRTILPKETRDYVMTITGERAEHWRGIRGNQFHTKLSRRNPCRTMPQFIHNVDDVVALRRIVRKAVAMMPRTEQVAATVQRASFVPAANAAPAKALASASASVVVANADPAASRPQAASAPAAIKPATPADQTGSADTSRVVSDKAEAQTIVTRTAPASTEAKATVDSAVKATAPAKHASLAHFTPPLPRAHPARLQQLASAAVSRSAAAAGKPKPAKEAHGGKRPR